MAGSAVGVAVSAGLLHPTSVMAAWPKAAFGADSAADAVAKLYGASDAAPSGEIQIKAPDIAENGAVVPVSVRTTLKNVESIAIIVEKNPSPLAASFTLSPGAQGYVSTRIKMGKTSNVLAVVKADGKLYSASKEVKVTIGGCGG